MLPSLREAVWTEALKARRSRLPGLTLLGATLIPLMGGLFMKILQDPAWAHQFGILTTKAQVTATVANWSSYFGLLTQAIAIGGFILFSIIVVWIFGREYSDRTVKDLLALPVGREAVVTAKFVVASVWAMGLTLWISGLGLSIGALIGLPKWTPGLVLLATGQLAVIALLVILLVMPLAWVASAGRGYLLPIGVLFLLVFFAQILVVLNLGVFFPWSIPALLSGAAGPGTPSVGIGSYLLVLVTGGGGFVGTLAWWRFADHI
jgi:ABC-2 type transport system permease protein